MNLVIYFPFFENLGFAIIHSFWQMSLLWLFVICMRYTFNISAKSSYIISVSAQFAGFGWFVYTVFHPLRFSSVETAINSFPGNKWNIINFVSLIYIVFLFLNILKLLKDLYNSERIRKNGLVNVSEQIQYFVESYLSKLEIRKKIKISLSRIVNSPLTIGYIKPIILLPVAIVNHLTQEQLEAVILHELMHIKRKDYLINILQILMEKILYFNPFIKLIGNISRIEREKICDAEVLKLSCTNQSYAEALLLLAKNNTGSPLLQLAATGSHKMELLERIKVIMGVNIKKRFMPVKQTLSAVFAGCFALSMLLFLNQKKEAAAKIQSDNKYFPAVSLVENATQQRLENTATEINNNKKIQATAYKNTKNKPATQKTHTYNKKTTDETVKTEPSQNIDVATVSAPEVIKETHETNSLVINSFSVNIENQDSLRMLNRLINTIISREGISESGNYFSLASYKSDAG
ncbi:MAG: M56 family metallopeptidase, partial [Chitinophagaceae bacterium]|nr:M56 family metallopeptidase [Chitinophagaceae bacterium]